MGMLNCVRLPWAVFPGAKQMIKLWSIGDLLVILAIRCTRCPADSLTEQQEPDAAPQKSPVDMITEIKT